MEPDLIFFLVMLVVLTLGAAVISRAKRQPTDEATHTLLQLDIALSNENLSTAHSLLQTLTELLEELRTQESEIDPNTLREIEASLVERTGMVALLEGNFEQAQTQFENALRLWEDQFGGENFALLSPLANLLVTCLEAEAEPVADRLLDRILHISRQPEVIDDSNLPVMLMQTATACYLRRFFSPALQLMERVADLLDSTDDPYFRCECRIEHARMFLTAGEPKHAQEKLEQAESEGFSDEILLSQIHHLHGLLSILAGEYKAAHESLAAALKIVERNFAPDQPAVSQLLSSFTALSRLMGKFAQAERLGQEAIASLQQQAHPSDAECAVIQYQIALIAWRKKDVNRGEACVAAGRDASRSCLSRTQKFTDGLLSQAQGLLDLEAGRYSEAESQFRDHLRAVEDEYGQEHLYTLDGIGLTGIALSHQGRYEEAEPLLQKTIRLRESLLPHPFDLAEDLNAWAEHLARTNRASQALPVAERAWSLIDDRLMEAHPIRAELHETFAAIFDATNENASATKHRLNAEQIWQQIQSVS